MLGLGMHVLGLWGAFLTLTFYSETELTVIRLQLFTSTGESSLQENGSQVDVRAQQLLSMQVHPMYKRTWQNKAHTLVKRLATSASSAGLISRRFPRLGRADSAKSWIKV